ncbi:deoxyribose-phosphate aldolase [Pseudomassariella vexata]|uniref:deoxyribose-phosphate aldolase n=1 Tax=Pseudomassariella vexata TaxID=1141098 RepID=A0A1Y2E9I3_9PEZI|nr:deoxyribose-phosphate aldolase [Pseudomassariella vexata]ORY68209.1 deoxyribose-phosphate aldolase [Pseudomassariella vexata]
MSPRTTTVTLPQIAKMIDHSLLHPTMTDAEIYAGLELAKKHQVAAACVKPYSVPVAKDALDGTGVLICAVIGFPHGNSATHIKVTEAIDAVECGAQEIDMVVNVGKVLGGDWEYVTNEIRSINTSVTKLGAVLKVIFENDYLQDEHIVYLCKICSVISVAFVKTSTGYGFVKREDNGCYSYKGATRPHLKLMKENLGPNVQIKAAGRIRTLDQVLCAMELGVARIGASATESILEEARARGIGEMPVEVQIQG